MMERRIFRGSENFWLNRQRCSVAPSSCCVEHRLDVGEADNNFEHAHDICNTKTYLHDNSFRASKVVYCVWSSCLRYHYRNWTSDREEDSSSSSSSQRYDGAKFRSGSAVWLQSCMPFVGLRQKVTATSQPMVRYHRGLSLDQPAASGSHT